MLQFLQPIWLYGIAGITLPVAIHLWNQRQGKVLQVGSIALLQETSRRSARRLRLSEWWLLLLRCLLVILLSLILAGPQWKSAASAVAKRGWVLVPRELAGVFQRPVDSLVKTGLRAHYFEPGFPEMDGDTTKQPLQNYWATLALLQQVVAPGQPVYLFTDRQQRHFNGEKPRVEMDLHWQTAPIPAPLPATNPADSSRQFTIWAGDHPGDAAFVQAALLAIRQFSGRQLEIKLADTRAALPAAQDWLFWLSDAPVPAVQARHVLRYVPGKAVEEDSWLVGYPDLAVRRYVPGETGEALWQDGFGHALLSKDGANYNAYTHFNSDWNELPWNARMPGLLLQLIYPGNYAGAQLPDNAAVQPLQVKGLAQSAGGPAVSLVQVGWVLLLLLFVAERLLSGLWRQRVA